MILDHSTTEHQREEAIIVSNTKAVIEQAEQVFVEDNSQQQAHNEVTEYIEVSPTEDLRQAYENKQDLSYRYTDPQTGETIDVMLGANDVNYNDAFQQQMNQLNQEGGMKR